MCEIGQKPLPLRSRPFFGSRHPQRIRRVRQRIRREPRATSQGARLEPSIPIADAIDLEHRIADPGEQIAPPGSRTTADGSIRVKPGKQATRALLQLTNNDAEIDARGQRIEDHGSHTASTDPGLEDRGAGAKHNQDGRSPRRTEPEPGDRRPRAIQARSRAYTRHAPGQPDRPTRRAQARSHQVKRKGSEEPFPGRLDDVLED